MDNCSLTPRWNKLHIHILVNFWEVHAFLISYFVANVMSSGVLFYEMTRILIFQYQHFWYFEICSVR